MKISPDKIRLYGVTDRTWLGKMSLEAAVEEALRGGVTMLQLREKHAGHEELVNMALRLKPLCRRYGVPLIINDDVQAALEADADGVHVGQDDMAVTEARRILGEDKIVGASAHNREEAALAERQGADYLGSGAVFGSSTKTDATVLSREELTAICRTVSIPVAAIGGITEENGMELAGTGVSGIAVVSGIFAAKDIEQAAARLRALAEEIAGRGRER